MSLAGDFNNKGRGQSMNDKTNRFVAVFFIFLAVFFSDARLSHCQTLNISGCSISYIGYLSDISMAFEKQTGIKVFVRGGGSIVGLDDLYRGRVDIAASCKGRVGNDPDNVEFIPVAWDALVFIVHKTNPVEHISTGEIKEIVTGKIRTWSRLRGKSEPIKTFIVRPTVSMSGLDKSLRDLLIGDAQVVETPDIKLLPTAGMVEQIVEVTPNSFGITGYSSAKKRDVRLLKVDGIMPTKETIASKAYKLKRPLFLVAQKKPKPDVEKFIKFVLSKKGQALISSYGVVPLRALK